MDIECMQWRRRTMKLAFVSIFCLIFAVGCGNKLDQSSVGTSECKLMLDKMGRTGYWIYEQNPQEFKHIVTRCADSMR